MTATQTITLQGIGNVPAVPASELVNGTITVWNFGYREQIINTVPRGKTQLVLHIVCLNSGNFHQRVINRTRLVGVAQ